MILIFLILTVKIYTLHLETGVLRPVVGNRLCLTVARG